MNQPNNILFFLQYNVLSRAFLKNIENSVPLTDRLMSMLFDFALSMFTVTPLIILVIIEGYIFNTKYISTYIIPVVFFIAVLTKDWVNGRSIGKRLTGFQVVDNISNKAASKFQCTIRNLTFLLWPLEALLLLATPEHRLGDFLARTKVVPAEPSDPKEMISN